MRKSLSLCFYLLVAVFLAVGCGGGGGDGGGGGESGGGVGPTATTGALTTNNNSSFQIDGLWLSASSAGAYSKNLLSNPIEPGSSRTIGGIVPGRYDARVGHRGEYSDYFAFKLNFPIVAGETLSTNVHDSSFSGSLRLYNNHSSDSIVALYLSKASANTWGHNGLSSPIAAGTYRDMLAIPPGTYDIKCVWSNGITVYGYNYTVESLTLTSVTAGRS